MHGTTATVSICTVQLWKFGLLNLTLYGEVDWGDISVEFNVAGQLLIILRMRQILKKKRNTVKQHIMYCRLQGSQ
jgi:hypothetical protein